MNSFNLSKSGIPQYLTSSSTLGTVNASGTGTFTGASGLVVTYGVSAGSMTVVGGTSQVSTSTTSGYSLRNAGAYVTLPTSGLAEGTFAYQVSDHTLYVSTEAVSKAQSWKAVW